MGPRPAAAEKFNAFNHCEIYAALHKNVWRNRLCLTLLLFKNTLKALFCVPSVSYTHLDVYKRQVRFRRHPRDFMFRGREERAARLGGRMFDGAGDDVAACIVDPHRAANGDVARFGAAAVKDDLVGCGTD